MTRNQKIVSIGVALLLLGFTVKKALAKPARKPPTGNVDIGTPTVTGPGADYFGGTDYGVQAPTSSPEMQRLIDASNGVGETVVRDGFAGLAAPE